MIKSYNSFILESNEYHNVYITNEEMQSLEENKIPFDIQEINKIGNIFNNTKYIFDSNKLKSRLYVSYSFLPYLSICKIPDEWYLVQTYDGVSIARGNRHLKCDSLNGLIFELEKWLKNN